MKEYLRIEKISFRYTPLFYLTRLLFAALVILMGFGQGFVMLFASSFSVGFALSSEEERFLPLTDEELKRKRLIRVIMIEIRYAILGILGYCFAYFFAPYQDLWIYRIIIERPISCIGFFVLQMAVIFANLLDAAFEKDPLWKTRSLFRFFFFGIPQIVFFIFTMSAIGVFSDATPFAYEFSELVNLIIFLCCGVFSTIYGLRQVRDWKIADIKLAKKKVR